MDECSMLNKLINSCDIYYQNKLISKEHLIRVYTDFIISTVCQPKHNVDIVLHTGSICFDAITVVVSAIGNLIFNKITSEDVISSLCSGDIVLYGNTKKERYTFEGIKEVEVLGTKSEYVVLHQSGKDITYVPHQLKQYIEPYRGASNRLDGCGLKKCSNKRFDFINETLGADANEISNVNDTSSIIVMPRDTADRLIAGISIHYGVNKKVNILDIVTASYFSENEEYRYGGNLGKTEPILKFTHKVSVARDLVFNKDGNRILGVSIIGSDSLTRGRSEISELLNRKSLKYTISSCHIDYEDCDILLKEAEDPNVFACTKEFLLMNKKPITISNAWTRELQKQTTVAIAKQVLASVIPTSMSWNDYQELKRSLYIIKSAEILEEKKDYFMVHAYSLLNLLLTSVFPLRAMEKMIQNEKLNIVSPKIRLNNCAQIVESFPNIYRERAKLIINRLLDMYNELLDHNPKELALQEYLACHVNKKIAVIVPKAYYADILYSVITNSLLRDKIVITTANRFDNSMIFDGIVAIGNFNGKRFDAFRCRSSSEVTVLLYDYEINIFTYKKKSALRLERFLNEKAFTPEEKGDRYEDLFYNDKGITDDVIEQIEIPEEDLAQYVNRINSFASLNTVGEGFENNGNVMAEVVMIGAFAEGEKVLFTKAYKAYVFDCSKETVDEVPIYDLNVGDTLVFTKNTSYTKDIVDGILEQLLQTDAIETEAKSAFGESKHWKDALREYMRSNACGIRQLTRDLEALGCTKNEGTIRTWLDEDAHIVGPRDKESYHQIAELTQDSSMRQDPNVYFNACNIIRSVRRKILKLIGISIINRLGGRLPENDLLLEAVSNDIDKLAMILQLESINEIDGIQVPIGMVNHPIVL